jgi:hypothetical protein
MHKIISIDKCDFEFRETTFLHYLPTHFRFSRVYRSLIKNQNYHHIQGVMYDLYCQGPVDREWFTLFQMAAYIF